MANYGTPVRLGGLATVAALALTACGGVETSTGGSGDGGSYPPDTVEMYVGASAGGSSDLISRAVSKGLAEELDASFPVINREGANGALAAAEIANAEPDGSTIGIQNASLFMITPLAVSEDEVTDLDQFEIVHGISRDDYVLVASPETGFENLDDLAAADQRIRYGTTGVGTGSQLSAELLFSELGVDSTDVPFDGGAPALTAVLGNQVDVAVIQVGEAIENIESGKLTPLTVFGPERIDFLPDTPTATEQGYDVEVAQYRFLTVPQGTPEEVTDTLVEGLEATFASEEYQQFNEQNSLTPLEIPGEELEAMLREDIEQYATLIEERDINLSEG